jgi:ADP-ribosylation factor GTPase-activating protein 1
MDAFKQNEILRMQYGGNKPWQDFFTKESGTMFDNASIKDRYDCEVGEEWKERLSAKVEDREFDKAVFVKERAVILQKQAERASTPMGGLGSSAASRSASPAKPSLPPGQKARNENYFAKMGQANASRSENLAPSQGGRYAGFGSAPPEPQNEQQSALPSADDFSKDPVAALTKGFGWFSTAVAKQAKVVNDSYIQPTAKQVSQPALISGRY